MQNRRISIGELLTVEFIVKGNNSSLNDVTREIILVLSLTTSECSLVNDKRKPDADELDIVS